MGIRVYIPCDELKPYIKTLAIHESVGAQTYTVLPDTGFVIGFQYKGKLSFIHNGQEIPLSTSGVTGLRDSYRVFKNTDNIASVLVFFKEASATHFFRQPLHELFSESVSLDNFMLRSELLFLEEQLFEAATDDARINTVERFLLSRMSPALPDKLVIAALSLIHDAHGNIRIRELMEKLHISQGPLEKRFRQAVGASPKKFASVVRMKSAIQQYKTQTSLTELGYNTGFYDQAHFIKEFKTFTGLTPHKFFADGQ